MQNKNPEPFYFREIGGPNYPASQRLSNVSLVRRGTRFEVITGDTPLAGAEWHDAISWFLDSTHPVAMIDEARKLENRAKELRQMVERMTR